MNILAAQQQNQPRIDRLLRESGGERSQERLSGSFHQTLIREDVMIGDIVQPPIVGGLAVDGATALDGDIVQVLAVKECGFGSRIEFTPVERGEQCGACLQVEAYS